MVGTTADSQASGVEITSNAPGDESVRPLVRVRYWAGARAASGVESEEWPAGTIADLLAAGVAAHPALAEIAPLCSVLVDGVASAPDTRVPPGATVEVLPPFAGG